MDGRALRERIEAEADAAEAESPDEPDPEATPAPDTGDEPGPADDDAAGNEPAPEPDGEPAASTQPPADAEAEKAWQGAEKASASYAKKIAGLLDPHAPQLAECPLCLPNLRGYIDTNDVGRIPDEVTAVVRAFLGDTAEADYRDSPTYSRCEACDGLGRVRTGSRVPNQDTLACSTCNGVGYVPPPSLSQNGSGQHEPQPVPVTPDGYEAPKADTDAWGSPRLLDNGLENPNYGKMPQYKSPNLP